MNNAVTKQQPGQQIVEAAAPAKVPAFMQAMADKYGMTPARMNDMIGKQCFKGNYTQAQFVALMFVANQYNLNPILKQIHAFPEQGGGIVPMVGIDGWLRIINEHPMFDGMEFEYLEKDGQLVAITIKIYRKDRTRPTEITEWLDECKRETPPWKKSPRRQLRHKTIIQGARVAFNFAGIYDEDEAREIAASRGIDPDQAGGQAVDAHDADFQEVDDSAGIPSESESTQQQPSGDQQESQAENEPDESEPVDLPTMYADIELAVRNCKSPTDFAEIEAEFENWLKAIRADGGRELNQKLAGLLIDTRKRLGIPPQQKLV